MIRINVHEPLEIISTLEQFSPIQVSNFTPGDYLIGKIAIERKTLSDFLSSLIQKRLFEQLQRMKSCYPASFLLVECGDLNLGHLQKPRVFYGAVLKIILEMNIKVLFTQNKQHTCDVILLLAGKRMKEIRKDSRYPLQHKEKNRPAENKHKQAENKQAILENVPGIGKKRAHDLLGSFGSLEKIFSAKSGDLKKVSGIGKKTAKNIRKMLKAE